MKSLWDFLTSVNYNSLLYGVAANCLWGLSAFAVVKLVGAYDKNRRRFAGKWKITIKWTKDWGQQLLDQETVVDPYSKGELALCVGIGAKRRGYYGLGFFELHDGVTMYAKICAEVHSVKLRRKMWSRGFPFFRTYVLDQWHTHSLAREKTKVFGYGRVARYIMRFEHSSTDELHGVMLLDDKDKLEAVGTVEGERTV